MITFAEAELSGKIIKVIAHPVRAMVEKNVTKQ